MLRPEFLIVREPSVLRPEIEEEKYEGVGHEDQQTDPEHVRCEDPGVVEPRLVKDLHLQEDTDDDFEKRCVREENELVPEENVVHVVH